MALTPFIVDGFDHYLDATGNPLGFLSQWTRTSSGFTPSFKTGFKGRGKCLHPSSGVFSYRAFRAVPSCTQISQHTALRFNAITTFDKQPVLGWYDNGMNCQFSLWALPIGRLGLYRGYGTTLLASSNLMFTNGIVHRLNMAFDFTNPTSGSADLWIDGDHNKGFSITATDLLATSATDVQAAAIEVAGDGGNQSSTPLDYDIDDFVFCYGAAQNIGEMELITSGPVADIQKQWTPSTGTDNFATVDELPPSTADFNSSSVVGNTDYQQFPALPVSPDSIFCITQALAMRKDEAGTRGFASAIKQTTEQINTIKNVTTSDVFYYTHYLQNPETLATWLASERTAAGFGYQDAV